MNTNPGNLAKGLILFFLITTAIISCQKGVDVNLNNISDQGSNSTDTTSARFSLLSNQGSCSISKLNGKYIKGHALTDSNSVEVQIKVAGKGKWSMSTGTVEGFEFSDSGYFTSIGNQTIKLKGHGVPAASGQFPFPLKTDSSNCSFLVSVDLDTTSNTPPPTSKKGPVANAGPDQTITLPTNSVTLSGSATDSNGTITSELWTQFSGPSQSVIISPNTYQTFVNNLVAGTYLFEFKVSDNNGATAKDTIQITVKQSIIVAPPPSGGDYFPITANSTWTYYYWQQQDIPQYYDSNTVKYEGKTVQTNGQTYYQFSNQMVIFDHLYRKDIAGNYYRYGYIDVFGGGPPGPDTAIEEVIFLKDNVPVGTTWESNTFHSSFGGFPYDYKIKFTVVGKDQTGTVNGVSFSSIITMKEEKMVDDHNGLGFQAGATYLLNYAKGIGLIQFSYPFENFRLDLISYHVY